MKIPAAVILISLMVLMKPAVAEENPAGYDEPVFSDDDRNHWSFFPISNVEVPASDDPRVRNPIDAFIARGLADQGLALQPPAEPQVLLRRLKLAIVGLPLTSDEALAAPAGDVPFEEHVDRLLASPGYGERWGQVWLDLARFAETDGFEHDKVRPNAWQYRDWVIKALNDDMGFDEFLSLQLAGDELHPGDRQAAIATMFCLSGPDMPDINLIEERRHVVLNELTSTVGEVFLGLQMGCAQCHDHKYDPLSQADFYRLRAVFEPSLQLRKNVSVECLQEKFPFKGESHVMLRGDFQRPGPAIGPDVPRVLPNAAEYRLTATATSAGRRTALAEWMCSDTNPLVARVIVNRIWQQHFGRGLVDTPGDFGLMGSMPTHPELLDWLAGQLIHSNWSLKSLHRLILTSAAWQQCSVRPDQDTGWDLALEKDPDGSLLSRFPRRRLEGEVIRDSMLAAAGMLNRRTGGPGVRPPLPRELTETLLKKQWDVTKDRTEHNRRSIYIFARRNLRYPIFEAFDRPAANQTCSRRFVSTTAPQSLYLLNSEFSQRTADALAAAVREHHGESDEDEQVQQIFLRILNRLPDDTEESECRALLKQSDGADADGLSLLALVLFNSNEFIFPD